MPVFNVVQRRINKRGEGPLYVAFRVDSKKIEIPVKYSIAPGDFDKKKKRVKQSCPFHQVVILRILILPKQPFGVNIVIRAITRAFLIFANVPSNYAFRNSQTERNAITGVV